jgi:hypothetical protein
MLFGAIWGLLIFMLFIDTAVISRGSELVVSFIA